MNYAITGITGKVGGEVARNLLAAGHSLRAVVRDRQKGDSWAAQGCSVAVAEMGDGAALTRAFRDAAGVFVLLPPNFDPSPGFPETRAILAALHGALLATRPSKVVCISTIGAQARQENLLSTLGMMEQALGELPMPVAFLRPAWFLENFAWDLAAAKESGVISSFLQPLERRFPMVATADVGRVAADLLQGVWQGRRIVELEGPDRVSPNDVAQAFSELLGRPVRAEAVPRETWHRLFTAQGMRNPTPRERMLDGFNESWIEFEAGLAHSLKGTTTLTSALRKLLMAAR